MYMRAQYATMSFNEANLKRQGMIGMFHPLFTNIDEMLAPTTLGQLTKQRVNYVYVQPFSSELSRSGSTFLAVYTDNAQGSHYILKRISRERDWIMRTTHDDCGRSVQLWQWGLLDRLWPTIDHAIIACAIDGNGWAILMHDITQHLLPPLTLLDSTTNKQFLAAMAHQHALFWEEPELKNSVLGLCTLPDLYLSLSPITLSQELHSSSVTPRRIVEGRELLPTLVDADIIEVFDRLIADPQPFCNALKRCPQTLIHGDIQLSNLGLDKRTSSPQVIALDWQFVAKAPSAIDLAWYLGATRLPVSRGEAISHYRANLARVLGSRFDDSWWQPVLELSLLMQFMRCSCIAAWNAIHNTNELIRTHFQGELAWWPEQVRAALKWL